MWFYLLSFVILVQFCYEESLSQQQRFPETLAKVARHWALGMYSEVIVMSATLDVVKRGDSVCLKGSRPWGIDRR